MHYSRPTQVCCARQIEFDLNQDGTVHNIVFHGGCDGNLKMISKLLDGWTLEQIVARCEGNLCRNKGTSCADQLAVVCRKVIEETSNQP